MDMGNDKKVIYLVTGAAGYLGNTLVGQLTEKALPVRALVLPGEEKTAELPTSARIYTGNVLEPATLAPFLTHEPGEKLILIHCAGVVSIASKDDPHIRALNVDGTNNILALCRQFGIRRLIYVSSVHAIPNNADGGKIRETKDFSPDRVFGVYARSKAEATRNVLAFAGQGTEVVVVHPSGLCGPNDYGRGNLTQLLIDYCEGRLTAGIATGGYDFVDVRDVAAGILSACEKGRDGETYILANRYYTIRELLEIFQNVTELPPVRHYLPLWLAKATARLAERWYQKKQQPPLYTPYSLYVLSSDAFFSHEKADDELNYACRPIAETVRDEFVWLKAQGRIHLPE